MDREEAIKEMREKLPWLTEDTKRLVEALVPELADEDERIRKEIINYLDFAESHNLLRAADYEKKNEDVEKLCSNEWSEEDRKMLDDCIMALSNWRDAVANYGHEVAPCQKLIDWLKSLRPQPKQGWSKDIKQTTKNTHPEEYPSSFAECVSPREYSLFKQLQQDCIETIEQELYSLGKEHGKDYDPRIKFLKSLRPSWKPSEQEKGALRTAIYVLTEERNFPKATEQLQAILDAFDGKEARKDWKPTEEQMEALKCAIADVARFSKRGGRQVELENEPYYSALHSLYCNLEKLM